MDNLALAVEALRRLVETKDAVATLAAERFIEEFLAGKSQLEQKIESLELLRRSFLPICFRLEKYPNKQYADSIVEYMDHRLRIFAEDLTRAKAPRRE